MLSGEAQIRRACRSVPPHRRRQCCQVVTSYEVLKVMEKELKNGEGGTFHVTCVLPQFKRDGRETSN